ncbi:MAG: flagellar basal body P-ring protein FlgI [Phycisphaeraceae bacterium]|nr:flagellar basal body P-ring protein FlgI [Phycisphaeraceae bacterium]
MDAPHLTSKTLRVVCALMATLVCTVALVRPADAQLVPNSAAAAPGTTQPIAGQFDPSQGSTTQPQRRPRRDNPVISIQEMVRLENQAASQLRGIGLVTGLRGTGDSGSEVVVARPLAQVYANNGNPIGDIRALAKAKSVAMVSIWCEIPESGGRSGDRFDVFVRVLHSSTSLRGGQLEISPMMGPLPGQGVFAFASGPIVIEDTEIPTVGRIRGGVQLIEDIRMLPLGSTFDLFLRPHYRSYSVARMIAAEINGLTTDLEQGYEAAAQVAFAIDDTAIRVTIPDRERSNPNSFIASILTKRFSPTLIDLPAQVVVNERTGTIIVTGDVEISAVTVGSDRLVVTTVTPPRTPSPQDPMVERQNWTHFGSTGTNADRARIEDLLDAFKQLNVPVREQIQIFAQINQSGRLHAQFITE